MDNGIYEVISEVQIRREPRIVEYKDPNTGKIITNVVGKLSIGTQRAIYSILIDKQNQAWGRLSMADSAGVAEWACIEDRNRIFLKFVEPLVTHPALGGIYTIEFIDPQTVRLTPK